MAKVGISLDIWYRAWRYRMKVERGAVRFVLSCVRPGHTAVDIGAHKGAYTYWLRRSVGSTGRVFAFEPQPELAEYLNSVKESLDWSNVLIERAAVSERAGQVTISRDSAAPSPSAKVIAGSNGENGSPSHLFSVPAITLQDYFQKQPGRPVRFIKCDAEGHELEVFRGARSIIEQDRPAILFECERRHHDGESIEPVFDFLLSLGYEGRFIRRDVLEPLDRFEDSYQSDPESPDYVNNFAFTPIANGK